MGEYRYWTDNEEEFLQEHWGSKSLALIAKHLDRSCDTVRIRAGNLGLSIPSLHYEGITLRELARTLNVQDITVTVWVKKYSFPAKKKVFSEKRKVSVVSYDDFWRWAKNYQHLIDFSKLEPLILGREPDWVQQKRNRDINRSKARRPWTKPEEDKLLKMIEAYRYTYPEISKALDRPEASIAWKLTQLNIKSRPVPLNKNAKYTDQELEEILTLLYRGFGFEEITWRINIGKQKDDLKGTSGVKGKLKRMGFVFCRDIPIAEPVDLPEKFKRRDEAPSVF